jgi:hypothetical protein
MLEYRKPAIRLDRNAFIARSMSMYIRGSQDLVRLGVLLLQVARDLEAVDEERGAACAASVLEEVESLEACGVGKVCSVSVGFEGDVCVGCVFWGEVSSKVVEGAVVGFADEGDAAEEGFCCLGVCGDFVD